MSKIAFDLDGVLVPDFDQIPSLGGLKEFYSMTMYIRPLFKPQGDYAIITARNSEYRSVTESWCKKYLNPLPKTLFHEKEDLIGNAFAYKQKVLNDNPSIQTYVESDIDIVKYLAENVVTGCKIIHFSEYVQTHLLRV